MSNSGEDKLRKDKRSVSMEKKERNHEKKDKYSIDEDDNRKSSKRS